MEKSDVFEIGDEVSYRYEYIAERTGIVVEISPSGKEMCICIDAITPRLWVSVNDYYKTGKHYSQADVLNIMVKKEVEMTYLENDVLNIVLKEEVPMTNLEKYKKELDEVQERLKVLKKKIAAESIEIGDEVTFNNGMCKGIVTHKDEYDDGIYFHLISPWDDAKSFTDRCTKTGRHFDGLDDLFSFFKYNERK